MVTLDELDRRLVHALQLDGRASFRRIAATLGASERLISRRYSRLRSQLALRVIGTTDPRRLGQLEWFVRVRTTSRAVDSVVATLASHEGTSWVSTLAGATEVTFMLRTAALTSGEIAPVLTQLSRSSQVRDVTAQCLLAPVAGVGGWTGRIGALTLSEQTTMARSTTSSAAAVVMNLTREDTALLRELATDARRSVAQLSRATGIAESTVRRRVTDLVTHGALRFEIDIDPHLYGHPLEAICWLDVEPQGLADVTRALATHPQVAFAATTTGTSAVIAVLELADPRGLHDYLTRSLGTLPAIRHVETAIVERRVKRAGALLPPRTAR